MESKLAMYARQSVPRYTSYPPATHFSAGIGGARYGEWLAALAPDAAASLYIHVPYCRDLCWYCGCNTYAARREAPLADFVESVRRELDLIASAAGVRRLTGIHWGGGTPNILTPELFSRIAAHIGFWFDLELREHALELDPRTLTPEQVQTYARFGATRASLGVQDLNEHVQRAMGRVQPQAQVAYAVKMLRDAGISAIGMDLMYGLPAQTIADVRRSVRRAVALAPQRIAMFGYAHVPWFKKRQRLIDESILPGLAERLDQAAAARELLEAEGYEPVGIDHFARTDDALAVAARAGRAKRCFQGYSPDLADVILGVGPSAISTLPHGYVQNASDVAAWRRAVDAGRPATVRGHAFSADDRVRGAIIERLMCDLEVDLSKHGGAERFAAELAELRPMQQHGLVHLAGPKLTIAPCARPLARVVAAVFDGYARDPARHALAV